jgi:hypothetical protein
VGGNNIPSISTKGDEFVDQLSKNQRITPLYAIGWMVIGLKQR